MEYNTIALAYLNKEKEIVAWSADTFGSPRDYPKTYQDTDGHREMLSKKFKTREEFGEVASTLVSGVSSTAGSIMKTSLESDKSIFTEKGIVTSKIVSLNLVTDYTKEEYLPTWEQVKACIDNKEYSYET